MNIYEALKSHRPFHREGETHFEWKTAETFLQTYLYNDVADVMTGKWHVECRAEFNGSASTYGDDCMDPWLTGRMGCLTR